MKVRLGASVVFLAFLATACGGGGGGGGSPSSGGTSAPSAPTGVSSAAGDGQVTISWAAATGAASYTVYYGTSSGVSTASSTKSTGNTGTSATISGLTNTASYYFIITAVNSGGESSASSQVKTIPLAASATTFTPNDPLFGDQWHLKNTGQSGAGSAGTAGEDLNVSAAWGTHKVFGNGIRIAVVDDGLDVTHPDLAENVVSGESYDYTTGGTNPTPSAAKHGTACAGLAAGAGNNGVGVSGVAMNANIVGYNLLANSTSANEADAMTRALTKNHIYSNSWGAADDTGLFIPSSSTWQAAIDTGTSTGRGGKGAIYPFAAGNGGSTVDRSDYDGMANYHGVLAVASLNDKGKKASYSEEGSNIFISAFGGELCSTHTTTTTDIQGTNGYNNGTSSANDYGSGTANAADYTRCMNGTSAATPEVSGVIALMLEANPNLTWREVRYILAATARKNDSTDTDWLKNKAGAGFWVNHKYGYGVVDAAAAVAKAKTWAATPDVTLGATQKTATGSNSAAYTLADGTGGGAVSTISISNSGITGVEFVDVNITLTHQEGGDITAALTSPDMTASILALAHNCLDAQGSTVTCGAASNTTIRFGVARLLGETANGTWTLNIYDSTANGKTGSLVSWDIKIFGY